MISPRAVIPPVGGRLNDDGVPGTVGELSLAKSTAAWVALVWFIFVWIVGSLGYIQMFVSLIFLSFILNPTPANPAVHRAQQPTSWIT